MMNLTNSSTAIDQGGPAGSLREALVGAWQFVSCVETDAETGEIFLPMGPHPLGFILYTPDGYMSAQLSGTDRANFARDDMYGGTPEEYVAAGISYLAYSGPYRVDEASRTVEHGMDVSLFPNWQGQTSATNPGARRRDAGARDRSTHPVRRQPQDRSHHLAPGDAEPLNIYRTRRSGGSKSVGR
jgi:Lipocalin-like domain